MARIVAPNTPSPKAQRLEFLDVLRALAVLLVIFTHASELEYERFRGTLGFDLFRLCRALDFGRIGVVTFFAISGFVIPSSLRADGPRPIVRFALHRIFRLYPAYWVSIGASVVFTWILHDGRTLLPGDWHTIAVNCTMLQRFVAVPDVVGLYWTLALELAFYVLAAALFAVGLLHRPSAVALVALALILADQGILPRVLPVGSSLSPLAADIAQNLPVMLWGYLARRLRDERPPGWLKIAVCALPLWYGARLCLAFIENHGHGQPVLVGAARGVGAYLIGVSLFALGTFVVPLRSRALSWIGRTSYSSYLFHPPVIFGVRALTRAVPFLLTLPAFAYLGLIFAVTLFIAWLTEAWIERPCNRAGRVLSRRLFAKRPALSRGDDRR
jgi:peptidoglycan/LPS O-acetylase OafA/YrhL